MVVHFVRHPAYGIGRVASGENVVRFFDMPGCEEIALPVLGEVRTIELERRQRVWIQDVDGWLTGYVDSLNSAGDAYLVDLPQRQAAYVPADRLQVRWSVPLADPGGLLKAGTTDAKGFHDARSGFVRDVLRQRAVAQGLAGVWSSAVELHAHQVGAARRVLADPVKRYLLADEVGLGKTVEAGMILRQLLIDDHGGVLVLVPDGLVSQWRDELNSKFRVGQFPGRVTVAAHSSIAGVSVDSRLLVVVDEAHRLTSADADQNDYSALCAISRSTKCLLLLSATPVRSNEDGFLRMLHLLDPTTYRLDDIDAFRRRVEIRDDLAEALIAMGDDTPVRFLRDPARKLRELLPDEVWLTTDLDRLEAAIDIRDADAARALADAIRARLGETHRIHRRLIRTRRSASLAKLFPVRGRTAGKKWLLADPDTRRSAVAELLADLLVELPSMDLADPPAAARIFIDRASAPVTALADLATALRTEAGHDLDEAEVVALEGLLGTATGRAVAARIDDVLRNSTDADRLDAMVAWAWPHVGAHRVAVASSFPHTAIAAANRLEQQFGAARVVRLLSTMSASERAEAGRQFLEDSSRSIIVIDRGSEEGVNLQVVEEVLHLDLPMATARLEQRLGRFDRWTRRGQLVTLPVRSTVFREVEDHIDAQLGAWRQVLDDAIDIFGQSSATLQYVLPALEQEFIDLALDVGLPTAAARLVGRRDDLDTQRRRIEGQDLLDTIEEQADDQEWAASMRSADGAARILGRFRDYVVKTLGFTESVGLHGTRYGISTRHPPRLTESQVAGIGTDNLRGQYTDRRLASVNEIGLLRWGEPIVDRFTDLTRTDERGRAFALEVLQPRSEPGSLAVFFLVTAIVGPDMGRLDELEDLYPGAGIAAKSQVGRHFAPLLETVWWHPTRGEPDDRLCEWLTNASGHNLGADPQRFRHLAARVDLAKQVDAAAEAALRAVADRPWVLTATSAAITKYESARHRESATLSTRPRSETDMQLDQAVHEAVAHAIRTPSMTIDACGVVFITGPDNER
ncbi:protein DpdE [Dactylosporangium sp. CA-052675]|uniref:protein DpdE n=1 Tax=Dactylosporangium sp. CA-052675 TaxID=3239927 RepID=UPI003D90EF9E